MRSAVILAGGAGSRLGEEKSLVLFDGEPLIQRTAKRLSRIVDDVVVVGRNQEQAELLQDLLPNVAVSIDRISGYGPVAGLAAGMEKAKGEYSLAVGCDLPFLNANVIKHLFQHAQGWDAAVPTKGIDMMEPLHAVYKRDALCKACLKAIEGSERRIRAPLSHLRVKHVDVEDLRALDPDLLTFFNINTRENLDLARKLWKETRSAYLIRDSA